MNTLYLSNRPHFLWVYGIGCWDVGRTREKLVIHEPKPIITHDLIAPNFVKTQFSQTTNSSTSKHEFLHSLHDNLWKLFYKKNQQIFMRGYNEGIRTFMVCLLQVENCTSNCTQLYFVESIRKNFVLTEGTGSCCNGGLHSPFTRCSGLRSVFWTLSWSRNAAATTWLAFAKLSHVTYVRTATDGNMSVVP